MRNFSVQEPQSHRKFASRMEYLLLLYYAVCMQECVREFSSSDSEPAPLDSFRGKEYLEGRKDEAATLAEAPNRPLCVMSWICEAISARQEEKPAKEGGTGRHDAGFRVTPPVLARSPRRILDAAHWSGTPPRAHRADSVDGLLCLLVERTR